MVFFVSISSSLFIFDDNMKLPESIGFLPFERIEKYIIHYVIFCAHNKKKERSEQENEKEASKDQQPK